MYMNDARHESQTPKEPRLLDRVRNAISRRHYSDRTEETYIHWIKRFIYFSGKRHPAGLGAEEVTAFLNYLAREREVAAATQNQALAALLFLYKEALEMPLPWLEGLERAKRPQRVPTVLARGEVARLLGAMEGTKWLMASLLYGAGLRLRECLKLRVKDVDFSYRQILVRDGKGAKDRVTMLPGSVIEPLQAHLARAGAQVPASAIRMGLEVRVSIAPAVHRSEERRHPPSSRLRELSDPRREGGGARGAGRRLRRVLALAGGALALDLGEHLSGVALHG
jgi:integrase